MKKGTAISIISIVAVIAIVLGILYFTNNADKTKKIEALNAEVTEKAAEIESLNSNVAEKDVQIEQLNASVTEKEGQIENLTADITEKSGQIDTLNTNISDKVAQIEALNTNISNKDSQIETLNADVADKDDQIKALNTEVSKKDNQIEKLNADIANKTEQIETLNIEVTTQGNQIETLNTTVADMNEQIEKLNSDVTDKDSQIKALNAEAAETAKQIETLSSEAKEKDQTIEKLTADTEEKAVKIETLTTENKSKDDQIALLKEMASASGNTTDSAIETDYPQLYAPSQEFVIERLSTIPNVAKIDPATEDNDPNGHLGKQGGYTAQIYFSSPLVNPAYANKPDLDVIEAGTSCGGSIEIYANVDDAVRRDKYLCQLDGGMMSSGSHRVVGTVLIRTSRELKASDQKKLEEEIIAALTAEETPVIDKTQIPATPLDLITVKESGFSISSGYLKYSFIAHNNMTDKAAYLPQFRITARDADGGLLLTNDQVLMAIYPDSDVVFAGMAGAVDETPASVEITYVEPDDNWHIVYPSKLDHDKYIPFEIKNAKLKNDKFIGELYNPNDYNLSTVAVTIIFRDQSGELLGGETTFVSNVKAGETVPFEGYINKSLITENFEVYAQPW